MAGSLLSVAIGSLSLTSWVFSAIALFVSWQVTLCSTSMYSIHFYRFILSCPLWAVQCYIGSCGCQTLQHIHVTEIDLCVTKVTDFHVNSLIEQPSLILALWSNDWLCNQYSNQDSWEWPFCMIVLTFTCLCIRSRDIKRCIDNIIIICSIWKNKVFF